MKYILFLTFIFVLISCKKKQETTSPISSSITESVYATGIIKSKNQYQVFPTVNGVIKEIYLEEGDTVNIGTPILLISNETQRFVKQNAELAERFSDFTQNEGKLADAKMIIEVAKSKMLIDSSLFFRQKNLWQQQIGTKVELEQKELAYKNSKSNYLSSLIRYDDLARQIVFSSSQAKNNLKISDKQENDFIIKSDINGTLYSVNKSKGEIVGVQTPVAVIGDTKEFILEMQIDEFDIFKVNKGQDVLVTLDSYKGSVFKAKVTKVNPIMNERNKSFLIEAEFTEAPLKLYPNITFEANIVIRKKEKTLIIPRNYLLNDSTVLTSNNEQKIIKTGLKDYQNIEVLSGLTESDELLRPTE
jgi:RND family efflux transporter MFP subunit